MSLQETLLQFNFQSPDEFIRLAIENQTKTIIFGSGGAWGYFHSIVILSKSDIEFEMYENDELRKEYLSRPRDIMIPPDCIPSFLRDEKARSFITNCQPNRDRRPYGIILYHDWMFYRFIWSWSPAALQFLTMEYPCLLDILKQLIGDYWYTVDEIRAIKAGNS